MSIHPPELKLISNPNQQEIITSEKDWYNTIILGDCSKVLQQIPSNIADLIVTSPPYADSRKKTYGGINPDDYVQWFLPISLELYRVLKEDGTFIINIKEKVVNGERHNYVIKLILEMQQQGWLWTEEYIWHKKRGITQEIVAVNGCMYGKDKNPLKAD
ncbi:putative Site-specific DNA-methyltransferase (cytosine-N(4)-specific) [Planktothrix sp. PCC 11201]|uniref:DNA methyltransferase n=1 Tax=Planktothrix sp. PCC 11201 TaxID=1729650 RepID=UPI00091A48F4|nr:DNA methyltransferase [Planktothrix sp. PCC 11201]SKB13052.1 putative Site-specific DNA-methyltransferase (cytosine-N(4)-specific) [Planktothrix sp. PCC 11201]